MAQERAIDVGERTAHIEGLMLGSEKRLSNLEVEVRELRGEIGNLRSEFKAEMGNLRSEFKAEMGNLRSEMDRRFTELKGGIDLRFDSVAQRFDAFEKRFSVLQWGMGLIFLIQLAILGKLFFKM